MKSNPDAFRDADRKAFDATDTLSLMVKRVAPVIEKFGDVVRNATRKQAEANRQADARHRADAEDLATDQGLEVVTKLDAQDAAAKKMNDAARKKREADDARDLATVPEALKAEAEAKRIRIAQSQMSDAEKGKANAMLGQDYYALALKHFGDQGHDKTRAAELAGMSRSGIDADIRRQMSIARENEARMAKMQGLGRPANDREAQRARAANLAAHLETNHATLPGQPLSGVRGAPPARRPAGRRQRSPMGEGFRSVAPVAPAAPPADGGKASADGLAQVRQAMAGFIAQNQKTNAQILGTLADMAGQMTAAQKALAAQGNMVAQMLRKRGTDYSFLMS
jgi:hypothetical protein